MVAWKCCFFLSCSAKWDLCQFSDFFFCDLFHFSLIFSLLEEMGSWHWMSFSQYVSLVGGFKYFVIDLSKNSVIEQETSYSQALTLYLIPWDLMNTELSVCICPRNVPSCLCIEKLILFSFYWGEILLLSYVITRIIFGDTTKNPNCSTCLMRKKFSCS